MTDYDKKYFHMLLEGGRAIDLILKAQQKRQKTHAGSQEPEDVLSLLQEEDNGLDQVPL